MTWWYMLNSIPGSFMLGVAVVGGLLLIAWLVFWIFTLPHNSNNKKEQK
jgi:hypothetical protein